MTSPTPIIRQRFSHCWAFRERRSQVKISLSKYGRRCSLGSTTHTTSELASGGTIAAKENARCQRPACMYVGPKESGLARAKVSSFHSDWEDVPEARSNEPAGPISAAMKVPLQVGPGGPHPNAALRWQLASRPFSDSVRHGGISVGALGINAVSNDKTENAPADISCRF